MKLGCNYHTLHVGVEMCECLEMEKVIATKIAPDLLFRFILRCWILLLALRYELPESTSQVPDKNHRSILQVLPLNPERHQLEQSQSRSRSPFSLPQAASSEAFQIGTMTCLQARCLCSNLPRFYNPNERDRIPPWLQCHFPGS